VTKAIMSRSARVLMEGWVVGCARAASTAAFETLGWYGAHGAISG
jgi:hypothetical protein